MTLAIKYTNGKHVIMNKVTSIAYVMGWIKVGREGRSTLLNVPGDDILELSLKVNPCVSSTSENGLPRDVRGYAKRTWAKELQD